MVAANRDEFFARPTAPLAFLDRQNTILAGQDLQGGGTWLGISSQLRFAALTNYRESGCNLSDAPSRGEIVMRYLSSDINADEYIHSLAEHADCYNGFNLILGDNNEMYYYSNRGEGPELLTPGFYGLSNHLLDTPWPKVIRGKELLFPRMVGIASKDTIDPMQLLGPLADCQRPSDEQLPATGIGLEWERLLSTVFIDGDAYGTRSSAVITVTDDGVIDFVEKTIIRSSSNKKKYQVVRLGMNG